MWKVSITVSFWMAGVISCFGLGLRASDVPVVGEMYRTAHILPILLLTSVTKETLSTVNTDQ